MNVIQWIWRRKEVWLTLSLLISLIFVPEAFAFAKPIVKKGTSAIANILLILEVGVGAAFCYFIFTLLTSRPNWVLFICILIAGVCLVSFTTEILPWLQGKIN